MSAYVIVEFTVKDPDVYREQYAAMDARFSLLDGLPAPTEAAGEST